jgi:hypothetical protein
MGKLGLVPPQLAAHLYPPWGLPSSPSPGPRPPLSFMAAASKCRILTTGSMAPTAHGLVPGRSGPDVTGEEDKVPAAEPSSWIQVLALPLSSCVTNLCLSFLICKTGVLKGFVGRLK